MWHGRFPRFHLQLFPARLQIMLRAATERLPLYISQDDVMPSLWSRNDKWVGFLTTIWVDVTMVQGCVVLSVPALSWWPTRLVSDLI